MCLQRLRTRGVPAIGLYADSSKLRPKTHIGAALAEISMLIKKAISEPLNGKVSVEGVKEDVVSFDAFAEAVPPKLRDEVKKAEEDLKSGKANY